MSDPLFDQTRFIISHTFHVHLEKYSAMEPVSNPNNDAQSKAYSAATTTASPATTPPTAGITSPVNER